jgi:hypothetical protein
MDATEAIRGAVESLVTNSMARAGDISDPSNEALSLAWLRLRGDRVDACLDGETPTQTDTTGVDYRVVRLMTPEDRRALLGLLNKYLEAPRAIASEEQTPMQRIGRRRAGRPGTGTGLHRSRCRPLVRYRRIRQASRGDMAPRVGPSAAPPRVANLPTDGPDRLRAGPSARITQPRGPRSLPGPRPPRRAIWRPRRWRGRCRARWSRSGPCRGSGRCP